jgi:hypothetical protein
LEIVLDVCDLPVHEVGEKIDQLFGNLAGLKMRKGGYTIAHSNWGLTIFAAALI